MSRRTDLGILRASRGEAMPRKDSRRADGPNVASGSPKRVACFPAGGNPVQTVRTALLTGAAMAVELGGSKLGIAVPAVGNLMGTIEQVLGTQNANRLARQGVVRIGALELVLVTRRRPPACLLPVLACFTETAQTLELAHSHHVTALAYVPWAKEERSIFLAACPHAQLLSADERPVP